MKLCDLLTPNYESQPIAETLRRLADAIDHADVIVTGYRVNDWESGLGKAQLKLEIRQAPNVEVKDTDNG